MEPIVYSKPTVNVELTDSAISKLLERTAEKGVSGINEEFKFINPSVEATCARGVSMTF